MTTTDAPLICDPSDMGERVASWMEAHVGTKETAHNSGPLIDEWLRLVGRLPGDAWCAATIYAAHYYACRDLGVVNPCPRTASALRLWLLADPPCRVVTPRRGDVYVLDHGHGLGHAGVVLEVLPDGRIREASGNTNEAGSREGNSVAVHVGDVEENHHGELAGWLRFSLAVTRPLVA